MFTSHFSKVLVVILLSCISFNKILAQVSELDSAKIKFATYKDDEAAYIQISFYC